MEFLKDYRVTKDGKVFSFKNGKKRKLKPDLVRGYYRYTFSYNGKIVRVLAHRLVAIIFIPNKQKKPCVNHIDGNKLNNDFTNLEWCNYSENERHSYDVLGKINNNRKLTEKAVNDIRRNCIKGVNKYNKGNVGLFVEKYQVDKTTILNVLNKKYYV